MNKQAGYEIKRWDESNCSFDENDFVRKCFAEKKWGYIGDYYRAKALYEIGGCTWTPMLLYRNRSMNF